MYVRGQALKGHLDMLLLAAVEHGEAHGYAISERLRAASGGTFDLPDGTIYPALRRLDKAGYVESAWQESGGRSRRVYRLTAKGRAQLARQRDEWAAFEKGVRDVLALES